jgi:hypothetical protein
VQSLKAVLLVLLLFLIHSPALGQKNDADSVILLGRPYSFILKAPSGWVLNEEAGKSQGLRAVLYKEGSSWKAAVAVMYVRVVQKDEAQPTLDKVVSNDISDFLKQSPDSKVSDSKALKTGDKKQAIVKEFYDAANKNFESVAFIDESKVVVIVVLSSRNKDEFDKSISAFEALVGTYFFVGPSFNRQ